MKRGERRTATAIPATVAAVFVGDDVARTQALSILAMFGALLIYMYRWIGSFFSGSSRVIAYWFLSLQPFLFSAATSYMSELPYLLMSVAGLYHVYRCDHFQSKVHSYLAAVFLSLSIALRPLEGCLVLLAPGLLYVKRSVDTQSIKVRDIVIAVVTTLPVTMAVAYLYFSRSSIPSTPSTWIAPLPLLVVVLVYMIADKARATTSFLRPYCVFLFVVAAWWIPFLDRTFFAWLERSTNWALSTHYHSIDPSRDPWLFVRRLYLTYLGDSLLYLLLLTVSVSLLRVLWMGSWLPVRNAPRARKTSPLDLSYAALLVIPHPLIAMFFHNAEARFYVLSAAVLIFTLLYLFFNLSQRLSYTLISRSTIFALTLAQCVPIFAIATPKPIGDPKKVPWSDSHTFLARGYAPLTTQRFKVDRLAEEIHARFKPLDSYSLSCADQGTSSHPGPFVAVNLRLRERFHALTLCSGFSTWQDGPVWPQKCRDTIHVFAVGDLTKHIKDRGDIVSSVRAAWGRDRMSHWGYTSVEELILCRPENPSECSSFLLAIKRCTATPQ